MRIRDGITGIRKALRGTNCGWEYTLPSGKDAYCEAPTAWCYYGTRGRIDYHFYRCERHVIAGEEER